MTLRYSLYHIVRGRNISVEVKKKTEFSFGWLNCARSDRQGLCEESGVLILNNDSWVNKECVLKLFRRIAFSVHYLVCTVKEKDMFMRIWVNCHHPARRTMTSGNMGYCSVLAAWIYISNEDLIFKSAWNKRKLLWHQIHVC